MKRLFYCTLTLAIAMPSTMLADSNSSVIKLTEKSQKLKKVAFMAKSQMLPELPSHMLQFNWSTRLLV